MIDHISLAVSDPEISKAFYIKALAPIDCHLVMELPDLFNWHARLFPLDFQTTHGHTIFHTDRTSVGPGKEPNGSHR